MDLRSKFTNDNEDREEDFFEGTISEEKVKEPKPKKPVYSPDTPDYWEQEESRWEHLKISRKRKFYIFLAFAAVIVGLGVAVYLRFFSPYIDEATTYGYVDHIEKRGTIFKTYEGVLINYKDLHDTTRLYTRDFVFTAADKQVAIDLKRKQQEGKPVRVGYKVYHATLPWRGASKMVITSVDSVDPRSILPPEFRVERGNPTE